MVTYGRLGAKIVPIVPKFGSASHDVDVTTLTKLGKEIDEWTQSTTEGTLSTQENGTYVSDTGNRSKQRLHVFLSIRHNQMRISLYKHVLYSVANIAKNRYFAQLAVQYAKENVQILDQSLITNSYELNVTQYSYFLVSSVAVLYLAVKNSSQHFGNAVHEYFLGLGLLKSLCTSSAASQNLCKKTQALEAAIYGLGVQGIGSFSPVPSQPFYPGEVAQTRRPPDCTFGTVADYCSNPVEVSPTSSANSALDAGSLLNDHNLVDLDSTRGFSVLDHDEPWLVPFDTFSQCSAMFFDFESLP
jgi:hypothetical protein